MLTAPVASRRCQDSYTLLRATRLLSLPPLLKLCHLCSKVGILGVGQAVYWVSQAIVDAKRRRLVARGVHGSVAVGERQADVGRGVDVGVARVLVAPPRAAGALGRDLPVGGVDVRSGL